MNDVLLPRTDTGVAVQLLILAAATGIALLRARRSPTGRWLVAGAAVFAAALMGLRAVH